MVKPFALEVATYPNNLLFADGYPLLTLVFQITMLLRFQQVSLSGLLAKYKG